MLVLLAASFRPPAGAQPRVAFPPMMQGGDKFSGGAVPFAPLGTAGDGSTANAGSLNGMSGHSIATRTGTGTGLPGRAMSPRERRAYETNPAVRVRRRAAEGAAAAGLGRSSSSLTPARARPAVPAVRTAPPSGEAASAATTAGVDLELRAMIQSNTANKKAAAQSRFDALVAEQDALIEAIHAERQAAKAELEEEFAKIDKQAEAAMALAME